MGVYDIPYIPTCTSARVYSQCGTLPRENRIFWLEQEIPSTDSGASINSFLATPLPPPLPAAKFWRKWKLDVKFHHMRNERQKQVFPILTLFFFHNIKTSGTGSTLSRGMSATLWHRELSHIAQNIAERCQEYFQYFIAIEILSQNFC